MSQNENVITVRDLHKSFRLPLDNHSGLKQQLINVFKRNAPKGYEDQQVLNGINFEVKKGEFFGIVGRNGSGKSTLLKLLAGIYTPDSGLIEVKGALTPFIELGVGFNFELTGRENIYLNCALLGLSRSEVSAIYDSIVEFAELDKFMDQKLKNYSSGMQVRLAFAIAVKSTSEILVFDEVLAVGDTNFQKKCFEYFRSIKNDPTRTVVLVTHDMSAVEKFCDRAIVLKDGNLIFNGKPHAAAAAYQEMNFSNKTSLSTEKAKVKVDIGKSKSFHTGEKITMKLKWDKSLSGVKNVGVAIFSDQGAYVYGTNTLNDKIQLDTGATSISYTVDLELGKGVYTVKVGLFGETDEDTVYFLDDAGSFQVLSEGEAQGIVPLKHSWIL